MPDFAKPLIMTDPALGQEGSTPLRVGQVISGSVIQGGDTFTDTLGTFYPVVISPAGNLTLNASVNHPSPLLFNDTAATGTFAFGPLNTGVIILSPSTGQASPSLGVLDRRAFAAANGIVVGALNTGGGSLTEYTAGAGVIFYQAGVFTGSLTGNVTGNLTGTIITAAQPNITSLGTLTSLTTSGLITAASLKVTGNVGFYNTAATAKQTASGSRGGNAALASLLTALATIGLITDSTSA